MPVAKNKFCSWPAPNTFNHIWSLFIWLDWNNASESQPRMWGSGKRNRQSCMKSFEFSLAPFPLKASPVLHRTELLVIVPHALWHPRWTAREELVSNTEAGRCWQEGQHALTARPRTSNFIYLILKYMISAAFFPYYAPIISNLATQARDCFRLEYPWHRPLLFALLVGKESERLGNLLCLGLDAGTFAFES
jgi:hypothetical protein